MLDCVAPHAGAAAADAYVCLPTRQVSVKYDATTNAWHAAEDDGRGSRYVLKREPGSGWRWSDFGTHPGFPVMCRDADQIGFIRCLDGAESVILNTKNLRFQLYSVGTYLDPEGVSNLGTTNGIQLPPVEGLSPPLIQMGICTEL